MPAGIVGQPLLTESGGKKILIALYTLNPGFITLKNGKTIDSIKQLWLEGIDARSGEKIWQKRLEWFDRAAQIFPRYAAATLNRDGRAIGVIACENRLYDFDLLTGQPAWPERKLPGELLRVQFADLRGDGGLQMLVLDETYAPGTSVTKTVNGSSNEPASPDLFAIGKGAELRLTVYSADSAAPLWQRALPQVVCPLSTLDNGMLTTADWDWPLVADLGAKGKLSAIIPYVDVDCACLWTRSPGRRHRQHTMAEAARQAVHCGKLAVAAARTDHRGPRPQRRWLPRNLCSIVF